MLGHFENNVLGTVNTSVLKSGQSSVSMMGSCEDHQLINQ